MKVLWNKTDICTLLNISGSQLGNYLSDECKKRVKYRKGIQFFRDTETILILKDLFPAKYDYEIRLMIGYPPRSSK